MVRVEEEDTFRTVVSDKQHQASVLGLAEKDDDVEGNKTKGIKHKVNLTGKATKEGEESFGKEKEKALQHPFVRKEFLNKATVNAPLQQDQHSVIPMAANLLVLEADGSMDARCSNMSHGIESIVEDSEGLLQDRLQAHNEAVSKENPIENKATEENKSTEEENNINTQRQPIFLSGPVLIGSKSKWRASQLEGINLQVELDPRSQRKSLRSQLYEDCMSPGEGVVPDTQECFQNLVQSELNITKEAGRRLGVDFSEVDCTQKTKIFSSACICRVPKFLRKLKESAYTPRLFAIGPLHRNEEHLQKPMKHVKMSYTDDLVSRLTMGMKGQELVEKKKAVLQECVAEMKKLLDDAKKCYPQKLR
ncbi:hypothetical protein RHGRI_015464 [Rhododendron griersonianum]|uniref:Uncharacterized protein n=1 Tax=Rhododendron griersonianum TaxID=479676 RepID=A0AAV6KDW0_9ERIC|nr:hypothetical protein RHGRI_015464 [Rhododendron griersonianum]